MVITEPIIIIKNREEPLTSGYLRYSIIPQDWLQADNGRSPAEGRQRRRGSRHGEVLLSTIAL